MITHQGIHTGFDKKMLHYFANVPYPSDRVDHDATYYAPGAINASQAQTELDEYTHASWNAEHIASRLHKAKEWATAHHARIICGEFGVLRNHISPDSRYRWIADVRKALEAEHIGWQLWDYTDLFGITTLTGETRTDPVDGSVRFVHPDTGIRTLEPQAVSALGLK
jgi:hypothetical protein